MQKGLPQKKYIILISSLMFISSLQMIFLPLIRPITKYIIFKPLPIDKIYKNQKIKDSCKKSIVKNSSPNSLIAIFCSQIINSKNNLI